MSPSLSSAGKGGDPPHPIAKVETGIRGLDEVLNGGVPAGALTLLSGGPGTGKTMLALEFLVRGAQEGSPGILLTFEERETDLRNYASGLGWDVSSLETEQRLALISARMQLDAILSGDFDLRGALAIVSRKAEAIGAKRLVIDAPDVFLRLLDNAAKERAELQSLYGWLRKAGMTTCLTAKADSDGLFSSHYEFLDYMAECVIHLDQRVFKQVATRRLRVIKYRGSTYGRNEYPFGITHGGVCIIPVTQASLQHKALGESLSSGIPGMDEILGGGYRRSSCTLITGGSGTGKTTFVCSFAFSATSVGERVLYLDFEESWDALISCMESLGIELEPAASSGHLRFLSSMPESQGIEEHLIDVFRAIEEFQPHHLVVDAISACRRMGSEHAAFDYMLRLIDYCKKQGITSLLTNLTSPESSGQEITGMDLSSIIDTVIALRNVEAEEGFIRKFIVFKSRGRGHSSRIYDFQITDKGIEIAEKEALDGR